MIKIRTVIFWITTPCSLRNENEPEDGISMFLQNTGVITLKNTWRPTPMVHNTTPNTKMSYLAEQLIPFLLEQIRKPYFSERSLPPASS